ncbi:TPA: DUF977 family protein [Salmonella enterica subsp. enterica serovar Poona]|nr:DUF977 family protein [Salmonella enterica]HEC8456647.1 DUF977 family protein [Salmonella enterica subsp. enterica serovar Poona]HEC8685186.1 DUF977 family protein [Salmonella enterica subsp. enterica serovar Oranienburg]EHK2735944.1 DUF977 family protein [Salmonella enterica]EKB5041218.1 DUF977 family protein [Salmonella enterica]
MGENYTPAQQAAIQRLITELVRKNGRMTLNQLERATGSGCLTIRRYVKKALECGDLYVSGKNGIFPSEQAFRIWNEKRTDAKVERFLKTPEGVVRTYDPSVNVVCTECRNSEAMQRVLAFYRGTKSA